jgi:gluconolactonase
MAWELVTEYDGWPNGLKIDKSGRIVITDYKRGLVQLDPDTGTVTPLLETVGSEGFKGVNDLVFGPKGEIYFTDQGQTGLQDATGRVYRLAPDGQLTCLINTIPSPNGIVYDPALNHLLVAVTRAQQIWRIPCITTAWSARSASSPTCTAAWPARTAWPWMRRAACTSPTPASAPSGGCPSLPSPAAHPLHGRHLDHQPGLRRADGKSLFITESQTGSILRADVPVAGLPMYSHA